MLYQRLTPNLKFREAFDLWLSHRMVPGASAATSASYLSAKTIADYKCCAKALEKFFSRLSLGKIHSGHLVTYQNARVTCDLSLGNWKKKAGANCVRKEIALMIRILRDAGRWGDRDTKSLIRLRAEEIDVQRALSQDEQHRFLHVASSREEFQFVYAYALLALHTTCSAGEMRKLRMSDVFPDDGRIQVRKASAKNKYRIRTIAIESEDGIWALKWLIDRAKSLGAGGPQHFLFPFYEKQGKTYNPTKPMSDSGLKKRWNEVRNAAGLTWFKPNGMRHTAITRLAEAGAPIHVILARAGHVTVRMQQHYVSVSLEAQRVWARRASPGYSYSEPDPDIQRPRLRIGPKSVRPAAPPVQVQVNVKSAPLFWISSTFTR